MQAQESHIRAEKITARQRSLNTQHAVWEQTGAEALTLNVTDGLQNRGGTFKTRGDLTLNADGIDNRQGRLLAGGKVTLNAGEGKADSAAGTILAAQSIAVTSGEFINDKGVIQANRQ